MALIVVRQMAAIFFVILVGYLLGRRKLVDDRFVAGIGAYIAKAALPIAVILSLQQEFSRERLSELAQMSGGLFVTVLCGLLPALILCFLRKNSRREAGVWMACAAFGNCIFMGQPVMTALYGEAADFSVAATMFGFSVLSFSVGAALVSMGGSEKTTVLGTMRTLLGNNTIIAALIGLILFCLSIRLPEPLLIGMRMVNVTLSPMAMMVVGVSLANLRIIELFNDYRVYLVSFIKLIVSPILAMLFMRGIGAAPVMIGTVGILAAMPTASTVGVLCEQYRNDTALCAKITFGSTLLSAITVPTIVLLVQIF